MALVREHRATLGVAPICAALTIPRASYYRGQPPKAQATPPPRRVPRALPPDERAQVLALLNDDRFADLPPAEVYATLLDEGKYVRSVRTMYRILQEHGEVKERRRQLRHPHYQAPELLATQPNQLWSWDITKLKGPVKWTYFYLYVILDVFSRHVVGWMAALRESATLAQRLIEQTCARQGIARDQLTIHADHGPAMLAKSVALLLADLGIGQSHSRPHVSNDNPFSESQFKTLKYSPEFPERFGSLPDTRRFLGDFFLWYNTMHHHSALGWLTPADVHSGLAEARRAERAATLQKAFAATPERFVRGIPIPPALPQAVWINKPRSPAEHDHRPNAGEPGERVARLTAWRHAWAGRSLDGEIISSAPVNEEGRGLVVAHQTVTGSVSFVLTASVPSGGLRMKPIRLTGGLVDTTGGATERIVPSRPHGSLDSCLIIVPIADVIHELPGLSRNFVHFLFTLRPFQHESPEQLPPGIRVFN